MMIIMRHKTLERQITIKSQTTEAMTPFAGILSIVEPSAESMRSLEYRRTSNFLFVNRLTS
jgi:hypothetical protein